MPEPAGCKFGLAGTICWSSEAAQQRGPTIQIVNQKFKLANYPKFDGIGRVLPGAILRCEI
jgi:hypothetical protein